MRRLALAPLLALALLGCTSGEYQPAPPAPPTRPPSTTILAGGVQCWTIDGYPYQTDNCP